jgi:predicted sulfurtransferase
LREFAHPASPPPNAEYAQLIHGWNDDVVPLANVYAFAKEHQLSLQILPSDHRLNDQIPTLERLFQAFLQQCLAQSKPEDPRTEWEREQEANFQRETLRATQPRIPR